MKKLKGGIAAGLRLGNLGFKVRGVTPKDVIDDSEYFAEILLRNKMIGFKNLYPEDDEFEEIMRLLYRGDNDPRNVVPGLLRNQQHAGNQFTESDDIEWFINSQWHMDNPFVKHVPCYTGLHMHTFKCRPDAGQTHIYSLVNAYRDCPDSIKKHLDGAMLAHATGSVGLSDENLAVHPALRTHPATGETILFWSGPDMRMPDGSKPAWLNELKIFMLDQLANPQLRYTWQWSEGDLVIWDNRAVLHSFSPGWSHDQRIFTRCESGFEEPYYNKQKTFTFNSEFGDVMRKEGVQKDETTGPNPDHIPLVFTKGIYALPEYAPLYQKVALFVYAEDGQISDDVIKFHNEVGSKDFFIVPVEPYVGSNGKEDRMRRFSRAYLASEPLIGQKFLFTQNGDLERCFAPGDDLFRTEPYEDGRPAPLDLVKTLVQLHPDLRHAGHAWHYPCWFPHQRNLQFRPWDWHNLSFFQYEQFNGGPPPEDFLVQFAIDTVYGCFNHIESNESRKALIERIIDYMQYMIDLGEYENDR